VTRLRIGLAVLLSPWVAPALVILMAVLSSRGSATSPSSGGVDAEVDALVEELRDLPGDLPARVCTPCNTVSKVVGAKRRREIYDRFDALGRASVPALARMLQCSLQGSDKDLTDTLFWILGSISGPYTDRDDKQHEKNDISAALPVLILALDDPNARGRAARIIGAIGPEAEKTVPKLVAMLGDDNEQSSACWGLRGIDPLPALRRARSDPNPEKRQFAQRAIASIKTKCGVESGPLEALARTADLICKATVIGDRSVSDDSFKPIYGFEVHEAELRVVSTVKGKASNVIRFRHYAQSFGLTTSEPLWDTYTIATGRTYLLFATQIAGDTYRELASSEVHGMSHGVLLAADAKPHHGTTVGEAASAELLALLKSPVEDDAIGAIRQLDDMSGGPAWSIPKLGDFERDEVLVAIQPLVGAKSVPIATAAITVFGRDSPYFYDQDVRFWLVGIGKGHIPGLGARRRPANEVVADIGAQELLQVATDGRTPELRALAIRALGRRSHAYPAKMAAVWLRDPSVEVRRAAILASSDLPDREPIVTASGDGSPDFRRMAALAAGFAQDPRLLPLLGKLLHDPMPDVRSAAALSLLSYPVDRATPVLKANLTSEFRPLFVNALASADPQPYLPMLAEAIEQVQGKTSPFEMEPTNWHYGGTVPAADSWRILFDFVRSRPATELTAGKFDSSFNRLEQMHWFSSGEPTELYALYVSRGLVSRAKQFRETARKSNMDSYFDRVDQNPSAYVR
jgi:HEAT repeat protein